METVTGFRPCDRYVFDGGMCAGWSQLDTDQDASYYGQWANPVTLEYFCYCEGDTTYKRAESPAEFAAWIREVRDWSVERGYGFAIDPMLRPDQIAGWEALGLSDLTH